MHNKSSQKSPPGGAEVNHTLPYIARRSRSRPSSSKSSSHQQRALGQDSDEDATTIQMDQYELGQRPSKRYADTVEDDDDEHEQGEDALMLGPASASGAGADEEAYELSRSKSRHRAGRRHVSTGSISEKYDPDDPMHLVSKAVPEHDDPTLPALTWRVLVIGTFFCIIGAAIAQLFFYKSNSPSFSSYFVILTSLPMGRWLANRLPERTIRVAKWSVQLNPGPFSIKEHMLVAIIASSGATSAYASDIINIQELFYHQHMNWLSSLTLLITTQVLGFGFAGMVTNLLVKPTSMIWPSTLVTTSLFHTLHDKEAPNTRARLRLFAFAFVGIYMYQFLPALIAPTLSSVAMLCLVDNKIPAFRFLSSGYHGLGFLNLTFDWNAAGMSGPFYQPWWAALNFFAGFAGMMYIVMPILYWGLNFWNAQDFPEILSAGLYDKEHKKFAVDTLLNKDNTLNANAWEEQKPMLLTPYFALSYGLGFATLTSTVTHVLLWHWKDIKKAASNAVHDDVHNRLMRAYEPVPRKWYATTFALSTTASIMLVVLTPALQLPVWALLLAIFMGLLFIAPLGILRAVSDTGVGLNIISEFVIGYIMPGNPIGNILFKTMAYMSLNQALDLVNDLKLGHYIKIPPKHMFVTQLWGTMVGCVVNLIVVNIVLDPASGYRAFLDGTIEDPSGQWDGRKVHIFFSASVIWGLVGPAEFFSGDYRKLYSGFLVGALLPLIPYLLFKKYKTKWLPKVAFPIILHSAALPPAVPTNVIMTGFFFSWLSQKHLREKHPVWFEKFNYVFSAALDAGASVNALTIFVLTLTLLKYAPVPHWAANPLQDAEHCRPT